MAPLKSSVSVVRAVWYRAVRSVTSVVVSGRLYALRPNVVMNWLAQPASADAFAGVQGTIVDSRVAPTVFASASAAS